jgi:hypothetical protein
MLWESLTDKKNILNCKILSEFPDKFSEYHRMNIKSLLYFGQCEG